MLSKSLLFDKSCLSNKAIENTVNTVPLNQMARKQNRSPNPMMRTKPNQFMKARFGNIKWKSQTVGDEQVSETNQEKTSNAQSEQRIKYLRDRFKSTDDAAAQTAEREG